MPMRINGNVTSAAVTPNDSTGNSLTKAEVKNVRVAQKENALEFLSRPPIAKPARYPHAAIPSGDTYGDVQLVAYRIKGKLFLENRDRFQTAWYALAPHLGGSGGKVKWAAEQPSEAVLQKVALIQARSGLESPKLKPLGKTEAELVRKAIQQSKAKPIHVPTNNGITSVTAFVVGNWVYGMSAANLPPGPHRPAPSIYDLGRLPRL